GTFAVPRHPGRRPPGMSTSLVASVREKALPSSCLRSFIERLRRVTPPLPFALPALLLRLIVLERRPLLSQSDRQKNVTRRYDSVVDRRWQGGSAHRRAEPCRSPGLPGSSSLRRLKYGFHCRLVLQLDSHEHGSPGCDALFPPQC